MHFPSPVRVRMAICCMHFIFFVYHEMLSSDHTTWFGQMVAKRKVLLFMKVCFSLCYPGPHLNAA
jgi:hypothetical protein